MRLVIAPAGKSGGGRIAAMPVRLENGAKAAHRARRNGVSFNHN